MNHESISRRKILAAASSGIALGLAGCSGNKKELELPNQDFEMQIPEDVLSGLELYDRVRERQRPDLPEGRMVVTVGSNLYEDVGVEEGLSDAFEFERDLPYRVIGPTYIDIAAGKTISGAVSTFRDQINQQIDGRIDEMIRSKLKEYEGVDEVEVTLDETLHKEYAAEVSLPTIDLSEYSDIIDEETMLDMDPIQFTGGFEMFEVEDSIDYFGVVWIDPEDTYIVTIPKEKFPENIQSQLDGDRYIELNLAGYEEASLEDTLNWVEESALAGNKQV